MSSSSFVGASEKDHKGPLFSRSNSSTLNISTAAIAAATSMNNSSMSRILNTSSKLNSSGIFNASGSGNTSRLLLTSLGTKRLSEATRKTPSKTPKNSPGRVNSSESMSTTPGRKTPGGGGGNGAGGGDRFIPPRTGNDFEKSRFLLLQTDSEESSSPSKREYQRLLAENLNGTTSESNSRILSYQNKAPTAPDGYANNLKVLYSQSKTPQVKKTIRHIPQVPERILDAPEIVNDYYLNLLDWSANNHLAVALGPQIYLWNAANGEIHQLCELEAPEDYVCSVRWIKEGNYLAIGNALGEIALWDVENFKRVRIFSGHSDRVGSLSWNQYILSSGSRSGAIHHSDVRVAEHLVGRLSGGHSQEVCGLAWSPNGRMLASGGNDNVLNIWNAAQGQCFTETTPMYTFTHHQAAVKAVAWCPWQQNVLASGGGTADRCIRLWNCNTGTLLNTTDTKSQVCALLWSMEYRELVSSHGFANNEVTIWKYPTMVKTAELLGHTERVLHMALSPDGSTVVSAGADETLRLWKCFAPDPNKKKEAIKAKNPTGSNVLRARIR